MLFNEQQTVYVSLQKESSADIDNISTADPRPEGCTLGSLEVMSAQIVHPRGNVTCFIVSVQSKRRL